MGVFSHTDVPVQNKVVHICIIIFPVDDTAEAFPDIAMESMPGSVKVEDDNPPFLQISDVVSLEGCDSYSGITL